MAAFIAKNIFAGDALFARSANTHEMQSSSLTGRQQQLGLLMGRAQPDVLEAARVAALLNGQSGSFSLQSGLGGAGLGLAGLGGTSAGLNLSLGPLPQASQQPTSASQLALPDQLALLSQFPHALLPPQQYSSADRDLQIGGLRNVGKTRSSDSRSSSAYASRHQAAEQRRRTRINERLELLRKLVPHAERANTACFLEEVIKYIEALKRRTLELESALEAATGKPVAKSLGPQGVPTAGGAGSSALAGLESAAADSPRQQPVPAGSSQQQQQQLSGPASASGAGASPSPLAPPAPPPSLSAHQQATQQQAQAQQQQQQQLSDSLPAGPQAGGGSAAAGAGSQHQSPPLQLSSSVSSQLAHLLPGGQGSAAGGQQSALGALFPHSGGALSLAAAGGSLSLGGSAGGAGALSLAQLTASLQGHSHSHHHLGGASAGSLLAHAQSHHHHALSGASSHAAAVTQQHLNDLQTLQAMHSLQQQHQQQQQHARAAAAAVAAAAGGHHHHHHHHPSSFHPTNNKAFLHFNEDLFCGIKPEHLLPTRSLLGAPAPTTSTTPSTSLQITSAHLPTDSNTLLQVAETARKTLSGSPVSSEESGVPLKKRKVLML